jgi:hypothetical protein
MLMRTCFLLLSIVIVCSRVTGAPIQKRDADFESVRTRLSRDHSGKAGDPKDKYFHESTVRIIRID